MRATRAQGRPARVAGAPLRPRAHAAPSAACFSATAPAARRARAARPQPLPPRPRRGDRAAATAGGSGPGDGEGEVYEVAESEDDVWASIALPVRMASEEGQQVEYLVLDTDGALAEPAVEAYLGALAEERRGEAAAEASSAREARGSRGGGGGGGGDEWALDPLLLRRMAAVRDAERGLIVQVRATA
jgi:hypothetical protein